MTVNSQVEMNSFEEDLQICGAKFLGKSTFVSLAISTLSKAYNSYENDLFWFI